MVAGRGATKGAKGKTDQSAETGWPEWVDTGASGRLQEAIRGERIGHAYLISGPKGVGKEAVARAFAQALCCSNIDNSDRSKPCGMCRACRNVQRGNHPDVETFSLESQAKLADKPGPGTTLTIETVRRLRASSALFPLESTHRVLIIDDAETLLEPAQQALLKTLEEPPQAVTILLLCDEPEALLETVRSRCQEIPVRPITPQAVETALKRRGIASDLATEIASLSRGRGGWALAAAYDKKVLQAQRTERERAAAWIASPRYEQLVAAFTLGDQYSKWRSEVVGVVQAAILLLRDEMFEAAARASRTWQPGAASTDANAALTLSRAIAASLQCLADLESNVRPRLALEAMVVAWPNSEFRRR